MKSFQEFISEAESIEKIEYEEKRSADQEKGLSKVESSRAVVTALKHAHAAKLRGDFARHSYWLKRAYSRLIGSK
jgi:hypothetical protein